MKTEVLKKNIFWILAGVALGRTGGPRQRELAWEVEAAGAGLLAVACLVGAEGSR